MRLFIGIWLLVVSCCAFAQDTLYKTFLPGEAGVLSRAEFPITILPDGQPYVLADSVPQLEGVRLKLVPDSISVGGSGKVVVYVNRRTVKENEVFIDLVEKHNAPSKRVIKITFQEEKEEPVLQEKKLSSVIIKGKVFELKTKKTLPGKINILNLSSNEKVSFKTNKSGDFQTSPLSTSTDYVVQVGAPGCRVQLDTIRGEELKETIFSKDYYLEKFEKGQVMPLENVLFKVGTSEMLPMSYVPLDGLVMMMKLNPSMKIRIDGHTDNSASKGASIRLSTQRAEAVKSYLVRYNIDAKRILAKGVGGTQPVVPNTSEENKRRNRRVEFVILKL